MKDLGDLSDIARKDKNGYKKLLGGIKTQLELEPENTGFIGEANVAASFHRGDLKINNEVRTIKKLETREGLNKENDIDILLDGPGAHGTIVEVKTGASYTQNLKSIKGKIGVWKRNDLYKDCPIVLVVPADQMPDFTRELGPDVTVMALPA